MNASFNVLRRTSFWSIITGLVVASIIFTATFFSHNNPILTLDITINRTDALKKAQLFQEKNNWLPLESMSALSFENDHYLQYFIELECGGRDVYAQIMKEHLFEPYTWHVRHFKEKDTHESHIFFTPTGINYAFNLKLPETEVRENLSVDEARELAKSVATNEWNIIFNAHEEIEASKDEKPCGRVDHTFVYQRTDTKLGTEGKYRIRLVVSGNLVTEVTPFIFVPEGFKRRYQEMRSSNSTISTLGSLGFFLLYLFAGCCLSGFLFFRKRLVIVKPAVYWAVFIGFLCSIAILNYLPLSWMYYDTATSTFSFLTQNILSILSTFGMTTFFLTLVFSVALTWDRLGFSNHIQFWKLWAPTVGASREALGMTALGYAYAIIFVGLATGIYMFFTDILGWWSPADTLTNPDILACYVPFLGAFGTALQAGFMEEALFRAVPIAAAVIAGRYFKREKFGLILGFIVQAVIFSACHANYPQLPGYFRLLELLIPSILFGLLYLFWGLLPGILSHFLYDLFLMELPVFAAHGTLATINKLCVIVIALVPLFVVLYRRFKQSDWYELRPEDFNSSQLPKNSTAEESSEPTKKDSLIPLATLSSNIKKGIYGAGIIGVALIYWCAPRNCDSPALTITKTEALSIAEKAFTAEHLTPGKDVVWNPYVFIAFLPTLPEKFIWQTQGKERYHSLIGTYLTPPSWAVRFASFTGSIIDRSEEFVALVDPSGTIFRSALTLAESKPGATLVQGQARGIALQALEDQLNITTKDIKEISAIAQKRPERLDWTFTFQDTREELQHDGQARIIVTIAGDKVINVNRTIFIPEQWQREQQQYETHKQQFLFLLSIIQGIALLLAFIYLQKILFKNFSIKKTLLTFLIIAPLTALSQWNSLPGFVATYFSTMQSYTTQFLPFFIQPLIISLIFICLLAAYLAHIKNGVSSIIRSTREAVFLGISFQLCFEGVMLLITFLTPHTMPTIGDYSSLSCYVPFFAIAYSSIIGRLFVLCTSTAIILALTHYAKHKNISSAKLVPILLLLGFSIYTAFFGSVSYISVALIYGAVGALFYTLSYFLLVRYDQTIQIILVATASICGLLQQSIWGCFPNALNYGIVISIIIMSTAFCWLRSLHSK